MVINYIPMKMLKMLMNLPNKSKLMARNCVYKLNDYEYLK